MPARPLAQPPALLPRPDAANTCSQLSNYPPLPTAAHPSLSAVLHDITPAGTFQERHVPPSPKLRSVGSGDAGAGDAPLLQRLQDFLGVAGLVDPYEQQQIHLRRESGSGRVGYARQRPGSRAGHGAQQQQGGVATAAAAAAGPRPYFWRLQQRLQAGGYRPGGGWAGTAGGGGGGGGEGPVSEEDLALLFRRQVYDNVRSAFRDGWLRGVLAAQRLSGKPGRWHSRWGRRGWDHLAPAHPGPAHQAGGHCGWLSIAALLPQLQDLWAVPLSTQAPRVSLGSGSQQERRLTGVWEVVQARCGCAPCCLLSGLSQAALPA